MAGYSYRESLRESMKDENNWVLVQEIGFTRYVSRPRIGYTCVDKVWNKLVKTTEEKPFLLTDNSGGMCAISEKELIKQFDFLIATEEAPETYIAGAESVYHQEEEVHVAAFEDASVDYEPISVKGIQKRSVHGYLDWTPIRKNAEPVWAFYVDARRYDDSSRGFQIRCGEEIYTLNENKKTDRYQYDFLVCYDFMSRPELSNIRPMRHKQFLSLYDIGEFSEIDNTYIPVQAPKPHSLFVDDVNITLIRNEEEKRRESKHQEVVTLIPALGDFVTLYTLLTVDYCLNRPGVEQIRTAFENNNNLSLDVSGVRKKDNGEFMAIAQTLLTIHTERIHNDWKKDEFLITAGITTAYELRIGVKYRTSTGGEQKFKIIEKSDVLLEYLRFLYKNGAMAQSTAEECLKQFNHHNKNYADVIAPLKEVYPEIINETIANNNNKFEYCLSSSYNQICSVIQKGVHLGNWKIY